MEFRVILCTVLGAACVSAELKRLGIWGPDPAIRLLAKATSTQRRAQADYYKRISESIR